MTDSQELEPPHPMNNVDPGAHQLAEASDSEDQFTDAYSGLESPSTNSPVPRTRIEKVDGEPSFGEVPGTKAYNMRTEDAEPDEIAVIPESSADHEAEPKTPTASNPAVPVPTTVVEEAPDEGPSHHSSIPHDSDAQPDILVTPDGEVKVNSGYTTPVAALSPLPSSGRPRRKSSRSSLREDITDDQGDGAIFNEEDGEFGDDFDDFEEGGQDDDFDDFEDGFQQAEITAPTAPQFQPSILPFSVPDFDGLAPDEVISTIEPSLASLFPPEELDFPSFPALSKDSSIFLTPRSASLWSQLVAPPPLAPPDWIRSRTRRLFLVSLGVPVDLDEILPASKQKKLVLPSLSIPVTSPRTSSDLRSVTRLKQGEGNNSSASLDSQGKTPTSAKRRKGPPPEPELDIVAAKHLCQITDEALDGMTIEELKGHVTKLEAMEGVAKEVLDYWTKRTDEKIGDREAFEAVIENLVAHARKTRK